MTTGRARKAVTSGYEANKGVRVWITLLLSTVHPLTAERGILAWGVPKDCQLAGGAEGVAILITGVS